MESNENMKNTRKKLTFNLDSTMRWNLLKTSRQLSSKTQKDPQDKIRDERE